MYPEGYMYPECILMYLKCILHALLHSKRIHVSFTFCMYFTRIPNESKIHFGIQIKYIKIHVSWALPWCHTGYMSGYIRICVSWTLHHDTSGYTEIQNHDTCILDGIHAGYNLKRIPRMYSVRYVTEMQDTCEIHSRYIRDTCICSYLQR